MTGWLNYMFENIREHPRYGEYVPMTHEQLRDYTEQTTGYRILDGRGSMHLLRAIQGIPIWVDGVPPLDMIIRHNDRHKHRKVRRVRPL